MDPNATLADIARFLGEIGGAGNTDAVVDLFEAVHDLEHWLQNGGEPPRGQDYPGAWVFFWTLQTTARREGWNLSSGVLLGEAETNRDAWDLHTDNL